MAGQMLPGKATTPLTYRFTGGNPNVLWHWYIAMLALAPEHEQDRWPTSLAMFFSQKVPGRRTEGAMRGYKERFLIASWLSFFLFAIMSAF